MMELLAAQTPILALTIKLSELYRPAEINGIVRAAGFLSYAYTFKDTLGRVIKYGMHHSVDATEPGERVYRQAWNIVGWRYRAPASGSGKEMIEIAKKYKKRFGVILNRNNVYVEITDQTAPGLTKKKMRNKCETAERSLIENYSKKYLELPVGNCDTTSKNRLKIHIGDYNASSVFN